ncbi:MAG: class I SAM-dependent methyltransferase [Thermogutta sp.]
MVSATTLRSELADNSVLSEIIATGAVKHPDGRTFRLSSAISIAEANALYGVVRELKPKTCIEIGMAYGVSTLTILKALQDNGTGNLISIDPYLNWQSGLEVAIANIQRSNLAHLHTHIRQPSFVALPQLQSDGTVIEFAYIDGMHTFDHAFIDFFYCDKMLRVGGIIGFDDAGWRSVFRVIRFLRTHRKYEELDVGLPISYKSRNALFSIIKWATGRCSQNRYFRKTENWEPPFNYYAHF